MFKHHGIESAHPSLLKASPRYQKCNQAKHGPRDLFVTNKQNKTNYLIESMNVVIVVVIIIIGGSLLEIERGFYTKIVHVFWTPYPLIMSFLIVDCRFTQFIGSHIQKEAFVRVSFAVCYLLATRLY